MYGNFWSVGKTVLGWPKATLEAQRPRGAQPEPQPAHHRAGVSHACHTETPMQHPTSQLPLPGYRSVLQDDFLMLANWSNFLWYPPHQASENLI